MEIFSCKRKGEIIPFLILTVFINIALFFLIFNTNSYMVVSLLKVLFIVCDIYCFYNIFLWFTLKYGINDELIIIDAIFGLKKIKINLKDIEGYTVRNGKIKGVNLSGVATNKFALGRTVIKKIGMTRMFVTNNRNVIYLKIEDISFGLSPLEFDKFEKSLNYKGIHSMEWEAKFDKINTSKIHNNLKYKIPIILTSIITIILILNPLILYVTQNLPDIMPIAFDAKFRPITMGTSKEFASSQMTYGALNMGLLFCMYYASYFYAKYDRKAAHRYLYVPLAIGLLLLFIQIRMILITI